MSNNRDSSTSEFLFGSAVIAVLVVAAVVWKFSTFLGLDMATGAAVFFGLLTVSVLGGISAYFGGQYPLISLGKIWPILLASFTFSVWPAIEFWATPEDVRGALAYNAASLGYTGGPEGWWAQWYTKTVLVAGGGFYGIYKMFK